jgi:aspartate/methionine/tyrosine aminotransferase
VKLARFPTHEAEERLRRVREAGGEIVPLHGTPSPALPEHVVAAVADTLARPQAAPPPQGLERLREALADEVRRSTGRGVDPGRGLVVTNGAMHALGLVFRSLLAPGDEVVVPAPCFFFEGPIRSAGGVPIYVPSTVDDGWAWDVDAIERAVGRHTTALLLCNPGNPTGVAPPPDTVQAVADVAGRHGLVLVADEAYEAAVWAPARLTSAFALVERALLVRSLGKSLSLPQLRVGLVAGPADLVEPVAVALEWDVLRVGLPPQAAALAALEGPRGWLEQVHAGLTADRAAALAAFAAVDGLDVAPPEAAPFLFVSSGDPAIADRLVAAGIPAVDGVHFQAPGWARVPFGGAAAAHFDLDRALARFAESTS